MKPLLLCLLLLTGCATDIAAKCEAGGGCVTLRKAAEAIQKAWDDGWARGFDNGVDNAPPSCKSTI